MTKKILSVSLLAMLGLLVGCTDEAVDRKIYAERFDICMESASKINKWAGESAKDIIMACQRVSYYQAKERH